jgi:hypothetical protein
MLPFAAVSEVRLAVQARADRMALFSVEDGLGSHQCTVTAVFCRAIRPCTVAHTAHTTFTPTIRRPLIACTTVYGVSLSVQILRYIAASQKIFRQTRQRGFTYYLKRRAVAESSN